MRKLIKRRYAHVGGHSKRITKQLREEIIETYLKSPERGTQLAMSHGLTPAYAYKLVNALGLTAPYRGRPRRRTYASVISHTMEVRSGDYS